MSTHPLSRPFNRELRDLRILRDHPNPSVNVLAIHGLGAYPIKTWVAKKDGWNWLENQLISIIPEARVWTFGYDSTWCEDKSVDTRLSEVAAKLLDAIVHQNGLLSTQLIFVAHSFGGIVVSKALLMAENPHNEWAKNGKALNLFQLTDALLFFGTPFGGTHEWFQKDLPDLVGIISHVDKGIFETFRQGNENLNQLRKDMLDKLHTYKKPNVGCFQELQFSNVGKIIGDENIPKVVLVQRDDAILADGPASGEPRFLNRPLERNHFDMQKFEEEDCTFQTVAFVLKGIVSNHFLHTSSLRFTPIPLTPDDEEYLKSLSFSEMDDRFLEIAKPPWDTCFWLLKHESYCTWLDKHKNLLCIKGKPGAGKSTLMKFAVEKRTGQTPVLARFFFHARGTELQKNSFGLYRSLLHQLLLQVPSLRPDFRQVYQKKIQGHNVCKWHVNEMQELLTDIIKKAAKTFPIFIYIDALDECGLEEETTLTEYLQTLTDFQGSTEDMPIKICFSCRHYPHIHFQNRLEILVEKENKEDITTHIRTVLEAKYLKVARGPDITLIKEIGVDILDRSSRVFQWVSLILKIIDNMNIKREPWRLIQKKIREVPKGLTDLYTHILSSMDEEDRPKTSVLLRWVRFARRPLTPNELRIAMAFDTDTPHKSLKSWRESDEYHGYHRQWKERITYLSGGLAEVVRKKGPGKYYHRFIVQFIHESVNDYLQKEGVSMLGIKQAGSVVGQCHKQIARSCIYYYKCPENIGGCTTNMRFEDEENYDNEVEGEGEGEDEGGGGGGGEGGGGDEDGDGDESNKNENGDEEFITYAITNWLRHSQQAENEHCSLEDILVWFDFPSSKFFQHWLSLCEINDSDYLNSGSTYLHFASSENLLNLANVLLTRTQLKVDLKDATGATALYVASGKENKRMVELLLKEGADVNAQGGKLGNALQAASRAGSEDIIELLLKNGANINAHGGLWGNALQSAAYAGHTMMVELLIKGGANVNAQGGHFGNALQAAAFSNRQTMMELLLRSGANVNAQGGHFGNALQAAAFRGTIAGIELLINCGADVNAQGGCYGNALQAAAHFGNTATVEFLLKNGANVNAQGGEYGTALQAAIYGNTKNRKGNEAVIQLLLEAEAKPTKKPVRRDDEELATK